MITLYRVVSESEKHDFDHDNLFRTGNNTLEAKQFFKSRVAIKDFIESAILQEYNPPYTHLFIITLDSNLFNEIIYTEMILDGYGAISIHEDHLPAFNKCVIFVKQTSI